MKSTFSLLIAFIIISVLSLSASDTGKWVSSKNGLPVYKYTGGLPFKALDKDGQDSRMVEDPFFIQGNYRFTLFTHVSGICQYVTGERAWGRLNAAEKPNYGWNSATLTIKGGKPVKYNLVGMNSISADTLKSKRFFGTGFARYEYKPASQIECKRIISVKPSEKINTGNPAFVISVILTNTGKKKSEIVYEEKLLVNYILANLQLRDKSVRPVSYKDNIQIDPDKQTGLCSLTYVPTTFLFKPKKDENFLYDINPPSVFMHLNRSSDPASILTVSAFGTDTLGAKISSSLKAGETKTFELVVGLNYENDFSAVNKQIDDLFLSADRKNPTEGLFINSWKQKLPDLSTEKNSVLKREMLWDAFTLESMATYNSYFNETFVPQGTRYAYQDGENISNRDNLQAMLPLCYTDPELARSCIRFVMKHGSQDGDLTRGDGGFGYIAPSLFMESDEQLYMFQSVSEYLSITKDFNFLNETVTYYPSEFGKTETVRNLLQKYFIYLRDGVGRGPNGLIRILNSDWSDSFFQKYSPNVYWQSAESHLNTAMALAVFPNLIAALKNANDPQLSSFITALEQYRKELSVSFFADFGNRNFSARCYLNVGSREKFGVDYVNIEPQGYLLQIPELSNMRKKQIYDVVKARTYAEEKIGFRTREKPLFSSGEGEDGGIWPALEGPIVLGVASFDKAEAEALLNNFTFDHFSKEYPDYWLGQWTGPDNMTSTLSKREGLVYSWDFYKDCFQGFCSHPHSWPLFCYFKLRGSNSVDGMTNK